MLLAARRRGVPMIIGSAGDTGTNSRVDLFVRIIQGLASKHELTKFRLGWFHSEVPRAVVEARLAAGEVIAGLDGRAALDDATLAATDRIVAVAGVHPFMALLDAGADVIIGGRSSDCAIFAAPALRAGFPDALSYYLRKGPGMRLVLRRALCRQGIRVGRNHHGGREGHGAAAGAALHGRLGRWARHV